MRERGLHPGIADQLDTHLGHLFALEGEDPLAATMALRGVKHGPLIAVVVINLKGGPAHKGPCGADGVGEHEQL